MSGSQRRHEPGEWAKRFRRGYGAALGLGGGVPLRLQGKGEHTAGHEQHDQRHLKNEHLPGACFVGSC